MKLWSPVNKMGLSLIMFFMAPALYSMAISRPDSDSIIMRREADAFLAAMPKGLQKEQAEAVEAAMNGDNSLLNAVRKSRDRIMEYSYNVKVEDLKLSGGDGREISLRLYSPASADSVALPLLIYFHGGGWTFGSLNSCATFCDAIASAGSAKVLAVDYALAPEHPYPEGLRDCVDAIKYAFENYRTLGIDRSAISIGGDSSGGNLALAASLYNLMNLQLPVKSLVLFYPVVKAFSDDSLSWRNYGEGYGLDALLMDKFNAAYCPSGQPREQDLVSPAFASDALLKRLPPVLMISAERDILTSQGASFARRLSDLSCRVEHVTLPGTVHLFITVPGQPKAFSKSIEKTLSFISDGDK